MPLQTLEPLTSDTELAARYHERGDPAARRALIERYLPFARRLALRYRYTGEPVEDLVQVASLGLISAAERFDPARGQFKRFAAPTILGELKRHFRDKCWMVRVPRDVQERSAAINHATERLTSRLGRSPTVPEIAAELDCTLEQALEASEVAHAYHPASLDAPAGLGDPDAGPLVDCVGREDGSYGLVEARERISAAWGRLSELEREVLQLRFGQHLTQREIAARIGYSQMHVSRVLRRTLNRLLAVEGGEVPAGL